MDELEIEPQEQDFEGVLYKKWFKAGGKSGFLSLDLWLEAGKASIDIGEFADGKLTSNTKVWCPVVGLSLYLKAVYEGRAILLYPKYDKGGVATDEGFVYYGGSRIDKQPVSRILKVHWWDNQGNYNSNAFAWKAGIFEGRESTTGAFIPDMSKPVSTNLIKLSRLEMAEMHYRLDIAIRAYAAQNPNWSNKFNAKKPKDG